MPEQNQNQNPDSPQGSVHETLDPSPRVMGSHEVYLPDHFVAPVVEDQGRAGIENQLEASPRACGATPGRPCAAIRSSSSPPC